MDKVKSPLIDLEAEDTATGRKQEKSGQRERLSEGNQMHCVYWVRLESHDSPEYQGYIGISQNLPERLRAHRKNRRKSHFVAAINKYGWDNLIVEILHESLSIQEALSIEAALRPTQSIGWNCQRGGELGVEASWYDIEENRQKHSEATAIATKRAIAEKDSTEARAERARENWRKSPAYAGVSVGSRNPRALLTEDQVREIKKRLHSCTTRDLATEYSVKLHVIQQIKSGKNWSHI